MRVFHLKEMKVFLPVRSLLFQRSRAKTSFNPSGHALIVDARLFHVVKIFDARNGTAAERFRIDRLQQPRFATVFDFGFNQIAHDETLTLRSLFASAEGGAPRTDARNNENLQAPIPKLQRNPNHQAPTGLAIVV